MALVVAVGRDLIAGTRITDAARAAGYAATRADQVSNLPAPSEVAVAVIDWSERDESWGAWLRSWQDAGDPRPRLVLFGPHTDLVAHAEARRHGLGPVMARSRLFTSLGTLFDP